MKKEKVPQDDNPTYRGYGTKVIYAVDDGGAYTTVRSSGWEAEEIVLMDVVEDLKTKAAEAKTRVLAGKASPVEYFMYLKLMDAAALAAGVGMARWRVKRHLTRRGFERMDRRTLQRYADFFNIDIEKLSRFKEHSAVE